MAFYKVEVWINKFFLTCVLWCRIKRPSCLKISSSHSSNLSLTLNSTWSWDFFWRIRDCQEREKKDKCKTMLGVWWAEINEVATSSGSSYGWERRRSPPRVRLWGGGIIEQLKLQNTAVVKNVPVYICTKKWHTYQDYFKK